MKRVTRLKTRNRKPRTENRTPLVEGVIPLKKNGQRDWLSLTDDEVVSYAKTFMKEEGINCRGELLKADPGLYYVLGRRGLRDRIGFEKERRNWASMKDEELIHCAKKFMKEKEINGRCELKKADHGLYDALRKRGLVDGIGFEEKQRKKRPWKNMKDEEIIEYTKRFIKENEMSGRKELQKADRGLYQVLRKRGLVDEIVAGRKQRPWKRIKDEELVEHAKEFMTEKEISGRKELEKADLGLYKALGKRGLLNRVGFEMKKRQERPWKQRNDEEIIQFAKAFMKENGISGRGELCKSDQGLYCALRKRGLLDEIGFQEKKRKERPWKQMKDRELIERAKEFMQEKEIGGRGQLEKADMGLYSVLKRRGLLDKIGFEERQRKRRPWKKMRDEELIEYAKEFMKEKEVKGRGELKKTDPGLYDILRRRKQLNLVFSDIEQSESERAIEQIIDFTRDFGERR